MSVLMMSASGSIERVGAEPENCRAWSDEKLVGAAKHGHGDAFGELCDRHAKRVFRVAQRITRNREDAEDAAQDSFLSAFLHLKDFDGRSRFATWLTRITINAALAKLRKKRGIREVPAEEPGQTGELSQSYEPPDSSPGPELLLYLLERKEVLTTAVGQLRPRIRKVVEFHQLQERSLQETAEVLGISTAAVKARMFQAKIVLRRMPVVKRAGRSRLANTG